MKQVHNINNGIDYTFNNYNVISCLTMPIVLNKHCSFPLHKLKINWLCDAVTLEPKLKTKILSIS